MSDDSVYYLAVYGTLQPGKPNQHIVANIPGTWSNGVVRGTMYETGWGAAMGYPAMTPDPDGSPIAVKLLHSDELPKHWTRLDEFEGEGYERTLIPVELPGGRMVTANIYTAVD